MRPSMEASHSASWSSAPKGNKKQEEYRLTQMKSGLTAMHDAWYFF